jgi:hypothetical protein
MVVSLPASVAYFGCLALPAGLGLGAALGGLPAQLVALVCSVVYPVLGILWPSRRIRVASPLVAALTGVAAVALVSAIGGACIYGLLTSRETMLRLEIFRGIKVAFLGPVVLVAAAGLTGLLWERTPWADARREVVRRIGSLLGSSITVWQLGLGLGLLVMLAIMVIRGGSEVAGAASGFEIRFRAALDNLMFVRPRTKECFVGHPLLMLGFYLLARGRRTAAAVCLTAGSIGAISVLNSFCHIHSPFDLAVVRTVVGYVVGAAIGLVACGVARLASVRAQQPAGQ